MKHLLLFTALLCGIARIEAQTEITGKVADGKGAPLAFANILLRHAVDSAFIRGEIAAEDGAFLFQNINPGTYFVEFSMVGFPLRQTPVFQLGNAVGIKDLGTTVLEESIELSTVEVVAQKALFEQKIDRLVVNVEGSVTAAGSSALEVLERSPGVIVNRQSNSISLSGKSGVVVMINGKMNYMTSEAVVQMLEGMSAGNISKIEILSTPPANMDAEGNAGYINIVLKKNANEGVNGSAMASVGTGFGRGEVANGNFNLNFRKKNWYLFSDYSYFRNGQEQSMYFYRKIILDGDAVETETDVARDPLRNNHNLRIGADYQISPKTAAGVFLSGYHNGWKMDSRSHATLSANNALDSVIEINLYEENIWQHLGANASLSHKLSENATLTFNADYLYYVDDNPVSYLNQWYDAANVLALEQHIRTGKNTPISIAVGTVDYSRSFGEKWKMDAGLKAVSSVFENDITLETSTDQQNWVFDPDFSANYDLEEKILGAYAAFEFKLSEKNALKAGLRYEYTQSNLDSDESPSLVDRQYGEFFPSLFFTRTINKNNSFNLSYSRRITRPTFNELAPFIIFSDPYSYFAGNATLQPAISNNLKAEYRYKTAIFTLQFSQEDSTIARFQSTVEPGTNKEFSISSNLKYQRTASFSIGHSYEPTKWWTMYYNVTGVWQEVAAWNNGILNTFTTPNLMISGTQTLKFPRQFSLEISGNFNSGDLFGVFLTKPWGSLNAGIQKRFGKNGNKLSLGYDNILNTMVFSSTTEFPEQQQFFDRSLQFTQPRLKLSYFQNFGNQKLKTAQRKTGAEEERKRVD